MKNFNLSPASKIIFALLSAGLFIGLFPWLFSYQGEILGQKVSIRALGDAMGGFLLISGVWLLFSKSTQSRLLGFARDLDNYPRRQQNLLMIGTLGVYVMGAISHKLRAQVSIGTHAFDLGFFSNICWNTAHGHWFFSSILEQNFMAVHVNWILWPLSFFYLLWPGAEVLLVAQAVIIAAALPILWKLTQQMTGRFSAGALAALMMMCSPYINHTLSNDFHPDVWQLPCLMASLWAWHNEKRGALLLFGLTALLAKEDVSVVLCGFGLILMLRKGWRATGAALFALSLSVFIFHTKILTPMFIEGEKGSLLYTRYALLGSSAEEILHNLLFNPSRLFQALAHEPIKYWRLLCYFFPMAGLTFLSPLMVIPPLISTLPHLLSQASTQLSLADIYALPAQSFLFVGAVFGAKRLIHWVGNSRIPMLTAALIIIAGIGILNSPRYYRAQTAARMKAFKEMRALVPPEASVAAQQNLLPHFDARRFIQMFPIENSMPSLQRRLLENPDWVAADRIGNALPWDGEHLARTIAALEANPEYEKVFEKENFLLFKRKFEEPARWLPLEI